MPNHVCINDLTISPTFNRGYVAQARGLETLMGQSPALEEMPPVHCADGRQQLLDHQLGLFHHVSSTRAIGRRMNCARAVKVFHQGHHLVDAANGAVTLGLLAQSFFQCGMVTLHDEYRHCRSETKAGPKMIVIDFAVNSAARFMAAPQVRFRLQSQLPTRAPASSALNGRWRRAAYPEWKWVLYGFGGAMVASSSR